MGIIYEHNILFGTPLCGLGRTWQNNSKMYFTGTECDDVNWIQLDHGRVQFLVLRIMKFGLGIIQCVPLATETGISLIILPLMRILQRLQTHTIDTFLFISHTTNVLLFKFRCNIFVGVRIIKEMPDSVASGTPYSNNKRQSKPKTFLRIL